MHISFNTVALVALVPLLAVSAAPVSIAEARDSQKRDVVDPSHMPLEPKYGGYPKYDEYSPPNPEKRSAKKREIIPDPNPSEPEPPNGPTVLTYDDYIPIGNPGKGSGAPHDVEKREPSTGPGKPTVFAYEEYGSKPDVEKRSAPATQETKKREAIPGPVAEASDELSGFDYKGHYRPAPAVEKRETSAAWPGPPKFEDYERYLPSPDVQKSKRLDGGGGDGGGDGGAPPPAPLPKPISYDPYAPPHCDGGLCDVNYKGVRLPEKKEKSKRQEGGAPTYSNYPKPIEVAAYAPKVCDPDGGVCYRLYDGGLANIQKVRRGDGAAAPLPESI